MQPIGILIADNHLLFQIGLRKVLEREKDIQIVGMAVNTLELKQKINSTRPDMLFLDLNLPGMEKLDTMKHLVRKYPKIKVFVMAIQEEDPRLVQAVQEGASGYVLKSIEPASLVQIIRDNKSNGNGQKKLTKREVEILSLMAKGNANRSIAQNLFISEKTVKNHVSSIFKKLEVGDRTQAVIQAAKRGLVVL